MSEMVRISKSTEYFTKQEGAKGIIIDLVDEHIYDRIKRCITVRQMIETLDRDFLKKSHLNLGSTRALYTQHTYTSGQLIPDFIRNHDERYYNFAEAGGEWTDAERILQLQAALPPTYDSCTEWYQYRQGQGTETSYDDFCKKVTDKFKCLQSTGLPKDTQSNSERSSPIEKKTNNSSLNHPSSNASRSSATQTPDSRGTKNYN